MEKSYKNIAYFFLLIFLIVFIGFFKSYFGLLPNSKDIDATMHFHGIVLTLWFGLLIIQPILIHKKQFYPHRLIGKSSYVLVPVIIYSMLLITKHMYIREGTTTMTEKERLADLFLPLSQMIAFTVLYILAMTNKRKTPLHLRYIIACSLVLLAPGLERIPIYWFGQQEEQSTLFAFVVTDLILVGLMIYDRKNSKKYNAYIISLGVLVFAHITYLFVPMTNFWQVVGQKIVFNWH